MKEETKHLARYLCELDRNAPKIAIEYQLYVKYGISLDHFEKLTHDLLPLITMGRDSPLSSNVVRGFATRRGGQMRLWLMREVVRKKSQSSDAHKLARHDFENFDDRLKSIESNNETS